MSEGIQRRGPRITGSARRPGPDRSDPDMSEPLTPDQVRAAVAEASLPSQEEQRTTIADRALSVYTRGRIALLGTGGRAYAAIVRLERAGAQEGDPFITPTAARSALPEMVHRASMGERIVIEHRSHGRVAAVIGIADLCRLDPPLARGELPGHDQDPEEEGG